MGFGMNMTAHICCIYFVAKSYYYFRKTGGIKGLNPTKDLPEDRAHKKIAAVVNVVADKAHAKMDEADMEKDDGFAAV